MTTTRPARGLPRTVARLATLLLVLAAAYAALSAVLPARADAHPLSTSAILLDIGHDNVTGRVQLPIDRLALAVEQPHLTTAVAEQPAKIEEFRRYVLRHTTATAPSAPTRWTVTVTGGRVQSIDGVDHLVYDLTFTPPGATVTDFQLSYDGILHHLLSHQVYVSVRERGAIHYATAGVLDWQQHTVAIPGTAAGKRAGSGFMAAVRLGVHHIAGGADHLLFLIMLLLPAPLLARRRRWVRADDLRRSCWRIVHVVTAFAIGHSITLALAALGYVSAPTRVVESMIAVSVLVSGVHAIRPLARGGEAWIATGFGLMHGLAFAALLGQLDLGRTSVVGELLGFNVGIELTQLLVVALLMPSLMVLSRTRLYPAARTTIAGAGVVLAAAWLAERTTVIPADPLSVLTDSLIDHPFAVAAVFALMAAAAWIVPHSRPPRRLPDEAAPASADLSPT